MHYIDVRRSAGENHFLRRQVPKTDNSDKLLIFVAFRAASEPKNQSHVWCGLGGGGEAG